MRSNNLNLATRQASSQNLWTRARRNLLSELAIARSLLLWLPIWLLTSAFLVALAALYQIPHSYTIDIGSPSDQAYVRNFHARLSDARHTYRWSDVYGYLSFPGLGGSRPFTISVEFDSVRTAPVTLIVNGVSLFSRTVHPGWQTVTLAVDSSHPSALASRDAVLEIRAPDFRTEDSPAESKGVKVASVHVQQAPSGGFVTPPYLRVALLAAAIILAYLFVGRALFGFAALSRTRLWGLLAALLSSAGLVAWLLANPVALSAASSHLVVTSLSMFILLVLVERIVKGLAHPPSTAFAFTTRGLALCVALGFGLRYGGMALPQSVIIDMPWHMKWLEILLSGNWQALYFPSAEGLSSVPKEWGLNVLIPKSPLFYFAAAPFSILPFDIETLVKWLTCLIDATLILAAFQLVLRLGGSHKAAVWASALYALMPLAFRAFAYGILPTIFAQWLATAVFVALLLLKGTSWSALQWVGMVLLVALALLAFPTVALFLTLVLLVISLAWWLDGRTPRSPTASQGNHNWQIWRIPLLLVLAWVLAIWAYYGLYISPVLTSIGALLAPKPGGGSTVRWPGGFLQLLSWTATYVVSVLPALLGLLGLALLFSQQPVSLNHRRTLWIIASWTAIAPLFLLVNYRIDMIGKHLFFTMTPLAVAGGIALWQLGRRGRLATVLAGLALFTLGWQGLIFWIDRLVRAST